MHFHSQPVCSKLKWKNHWESKIWQNSPDEIPASVFPTYSLKVVASVRAKEEKLRSLRGWKYENYIAVYDLLPMTI